MKGMTLFINIFKNIEMQGYTVIETSSKQNKGIDENQGNL